MKNSMLKTMAVALLAIAMPVVADTVVYTIKQTPVPLETVNGTYVVPAGATVPYYYYTLDNTQYVCSTQPISDLSSVTPTVVQIQSNGVTTSTNCWPSTYFVINPQ